MGTIIRKLSLLLTVAAIATAARGGDDGQQFYRWVDENGVVHYGDHVPAQYSKTERDIINQRGVKVGNMAGEMTDEQRAAEARAAKEEEQDRQAEIEQRERDNILLNTYLSVEEIEALRNRRMELIQGQIRVTEIYLRNLRDKRAKLEAEASRYRPYSTDPDARPIPNNLAQELSDTLNSIILYEKNLESARTQQTQLVAKFDADIDRFKTLKGID